MTVICIIAYKLMIFSPMECYLLALIFFTQKSRHLLGHHLNLAKYNPIKYLLSRQAMSRHIAQWLLQLSEFDITFVALRRLLINLSDLIAQFSCEEGELLHEDLPYEKISLVENGQWRLGFDSSSTSSMRLGRVVLFAHDGTVVSLLFKLEFLSSNKAVGYNALIIGPISTLQMRVCILIIKQVNRVFTFKEITPVYYRTVTQKLIRYFSNIRFEYINRQ